MTDEDRGPLVLGDVCELAGHGAAQDFAIYAPELVELKVRPGLRY